MEIGSAAAQALANGERVWGEGGALHTSAFATSFTLVIVVVQMR